MAQPSCIFFLADGARADLFERLLREGRLPNISRHIVERGSFRKGTTVFPSTTGPAYLPFVTGCFPGRANVPGIRWFDRKEYARTRFSLRRHRSYVGIESALFNRDFRPDFPTLFDVAEKPINLFSVVNRGAGRGNLTRLSRMWYVYYAHLTDRWAFVDRVSIEKLLKALSGQPDFIFSVLPAIDEYAHLSDPFGEYTVRAYEEMDRLIGQVVEKLKALGRYDSTLLVLSSDHGLSSTRKHFGVDTFLEKRGVKTFFYPLIFKRNFDAATMVSGNGMCHVYIKGKKSWGDEVWLDEIRQLPEKIPQALLEQEAVDFIAGRTREGDVQVISKRGEARISKQGDCYTLKNISGNALGIADASGLSAEAALQHTFATDYPDAIVQLTQIFQSPRTGDIVVSAKSGFDLRDRFESPEHRSSHGSLHWEHMHVPIACSRALQEGPLRTVDLFSVMLNHLQKEGSRDFSHIDGVDRLWNSGDSAETKERTYVRA